MWIPWECKVTTCKNTHYFAEESQFFFNSNFWFCENLGSFRIVGLGGDGLKLLAHVLVGDVMYPVPYDWNPGFLSLLSLSGGVLVIST